MDTIDSVGHTDQRTVAGVKTRVNSNMEAEDIVADAIKLNVDDDLNEHREEHDDRSYEGDANDESYDEHDTYDQNEEEEEPNYEEDVLMDEDEQQQLQQHEDEENYEGDHDGEHYENNDDEEEEDVGGEDHQDDDREQDNDDDEGTNNVDHEHADEATNGKIGGQAIDVDRKTEQTKQKSEHLDRSTSTNTTKKHNTSASKSSEKSKTNSNSKNSVKDSKKTDSSKDSKKTDSSKDAKNTSKSKSSSSSKDKSKDSKDSKSSPSDKNETHNDKVLWVSGLTAKVRASDLQTLFKKHGTVVGAKIIKNTRIPGSRFYGLITMETVEQAQSCIKHLNSATLDNRPITVEKNRLSERRQNTIHRERRETNVDNRVRVGGEDARDNRRRDRSPRRPRSRSPPRRFQRPFGGGGARRLGHFSSRGGRGGAAGGPVGVRGGYASGGHPNPYFGRKSEPERLFSRRELVRENERRRSDIEDRRQRDLERRQFEEREKLEREKLRLKLERERLEREKAEFLRMEREKARIERERIEREREELRRKASQLPTHRTSGGGPPSGSSAKRSYEDSFGWDERKRFSGSSSTMIASSRPSFVDAPPPPPPSSSHFAGLSTSRATEDDFERRKLDTFSSLTRTSNSEFDSRGRSSGHDRDDRRGTTSNGSTLGYMRDSLRSGLTSERSSDRSRPSLSLRDHRSSSDWKSDRRDSRFLDKSLSSSAGNGFGIGNSRSSFGASDSRSDWASSDRLASASSLSKLSYGPGTTESANDRPRMIQIPIERNDSLLNLYNSGPPTDAGHDSYTSLSSSVSYRRF